MTDQEPAGYRGKLVYSQEEDGYKLITMTVNLYPTEQSHVMSHIYNLPFIEEPEHLSTSSPLVKMDSYHFPATDGTNIMLTVESQEGIRHTAVYSVHEGGIEEHSPFPWLDIVEANVGQKELAQEPQAAQHEWQAALNEALEYYKDEIPGWIEAQDRLDTTIREPFHDHHIDFDR
jgi:hypothetical protein